MTRITGIWGFVATLKDVAKHAKVSAMTVSHIVNGTKAVRPEVRQRVLESIQELDYQPNRSARALRTKQNSTLGLIVPDLTNPFFPELIETLEREARCRGYATLLINSNRDIEVERQGFRLLSQHGVDGVIWCPHATHPQLEKLPFPVVVIDRPHKAFDSVSADHYGGGKLQGKYALEHGHERIGILKGPQTFVNAKARYEGLLAALGKIDLVWQFEVPFSLLLELPPIVIKKLKENEVTLIIATNDVVAIATLRTLHEMGRRVPEEVSLLGFDDTSWATLVYPALTTIRQPIADLAACAVTTLVKRIHEPNRKVEHITLPVNLVHRQSSLERRSVETG